MKNISRKAGALFFFLMVLVLWTKIPELLAMGANNASAPLKKPITKTLCSWFGKHSGRCAGRDTDEGPIESIHTHLDPSERAVFFRHSQRPRCDWGKGNIVQAGVPLIGLISQSLESGHFSGSALIELQLTRIIMPDGTTLPISYRNISKK